MKQILPWKTGGGEASDWTGFLDRDARVEGRLETAGTFRLDGSAKGRIVCGHILVLGEAAEVEGELEAEEVVIYGRFRGTIRASARVELHSGAQVTADLYTPCLMLEPGVRFDGHCYLNKAGGERGELLLVPIRAAPSGDAPET
ncbi:MAG TPA: polymer-forming cytoskeletal protein [Candidatus Acidoferrales bacterium]|nr:polymer-forming cytoskeletal protein [Candidatus Acidoferrales bacterium]